MDNITGSLGAAPIWKQLMEEFLKDKDEHHLNPPDNVIELTVCPQNGLPLRENLPGFGMKEYFIKGTEPAKECVLKTTHGSYEKNEENNQKS